MYDNVGRRGEKNKRPKGKEGPSAEGGGQTGESMESSFAATQSELNT